MFIPGIVASSFKRITALVSDWWSWDGTNDVVSVTDLVSNGVNANSLVVLSETKGVIAYFGGGGINARVFNRTGTTLAYGTELQIETTGFALSSIYKLSDTKLVLFYRPNAAPYYAYCRILEISGDTVTAGLRHTVNDGNLAWNREAMPLTSTKFVMCYHDVADGDDAVLRVGDVSGTNIAWGAEYKPDTNAANYVGMSQISATRGIMAREYTGTDHDAVIFDVAGTVVTFNTSKDLALTNAGNPYMQTAIDETKTRGVTVFTSGTGTPGTGHGMALAISGTTITNGVDTSLTASGASWGCGVSYLGSDVSNDYYIMIVNDDTDSSLMKVKVFRVALGGTVITSTGPEVTVFDGVEAGGSSPDIIYMAPGYAVAAVANTDAVRMIVLTTL